MIFHPDLAALVLAGAKTQTRRPVKPGKPPRYVPGRSYAVQDRRGGKALARIHVDAVTIVPCAAITSEDAAAEGFESPAAFRERWVAMYGHDLGCAYRIEFELQAAG